MNAVSKIAVGVAALLIATNAWAEESAEGKQDASPRYSLSSGADLSKVEVKPALESELPPPSAFEWKALTGNGAAAGSDPIVGAGSGRPYYDFKDPQPYPYYVYSARRQ